MILRLVAVVALVMTSFAVAPVTAAAAQESDEPTTAVVEEPGDDEASNLSALLIGAVLLGAGVWAYMNKKKRFPGARFRD